MLEDEKIVIKALDKVTYLPGSWNKRFAGSMVSLMMASPEKELSEKQKEWIYRLLYRYRRQVPNTYDKYKDHEFCNKIEYKRDYGNKEVDRET